MPRANQWTLVRPIVERLLALPPAQREEALARELGADVELRAKLARLLRAAEQRRGVFEPATGSGGGVADLLESRAAPQAGDSVGTWRLVRALGTGGMGEVWLAEREGADFRQRAALKLVKRGMDTDAVLARFRRERKVLAQLAHPAIPSLIDGGASADGRPYLVMEFVEGVPLDVFVRARALGLEARLRLFIAICEAVQHAHERGVVHRDLKPSNVLVTSAGEPRLLDFGISKVLEDGEESHTLDLTLTGQQLLTPRYASPEQVQGREITAAADVYALGLILWELLVGKPAVSFDGLTRADFSVAVCERDVPRPSTAVEPNATALRRAIAGDLDTICAMALRKEPQRRYANVKQLAGDVRRHLAAEPVLARADTMTYRVSKFVRRNKTLVGATLGIMLALAIGLVIALLQYREALRASLAAKRSAYAANLEAAEAALREGDARTAVVRLEGAPEELRGWEWRHMSSRTDGSLVQFPTEFEGAVTGAALTWLDDESSFVARQDHDLVVRRGARIVDRAELCAPTGASYAPRSRRIAWCSHYGGLFVATLDGGLSGAAAWANDPGRPDLEVAHLDVAWSPDERWLALSSRHGLRLYDGASGALLHEFPNSSPATSCARIAWSPRSPLIARANWEETIDVFDAERLELVTSWRAHTMGIYDLAFDASGERLASCALDRTAKVWDFARQSEVCVIRRPRLINAVTFVGDELLLGESNGAITGFDSRNGAHLRTLVGHWSHIVGLEVSPDRSRILSLDLASAARIWSSAARDGLSARTCEFVNAIRPSPDGERFVTSAPDGVVRVWDLESCEVECESRLDRGYMLGADWSPDGRWIATSHDSEVAALWNAESLSLERTFDAPPGWIAGTVVFASDSASLFAVLVAPYYDPSLVRRWSLDGRALEDWNISLASRSNVPDLVLDARDAPRLVSGGYVELDAWGADGELTRLDPFHPAPMVAATASPDRSLVAAAYNEEVLVAGAKDFTVIARFQTHADDVKSLAIHPVEKRIAAAVGETIELWDWSVPYRVAVLRGHEGVVSDVTWTPDGSALLSVSRDGGVRVWSSMR